MTLVSRPASRVRDQQGIIQPRPVALQWRSDRAASHEGAQSGSARLRVDCLRKLAGISSRDTPKQKERAA